MSLEPGATIGAYTIISKLGEGGMGQVYRARDSRLNRDVAIKVLPEVFASDPERLARFTREAQALAAINHPNIAQIYAVETTSGVVSSKTTPDVVSKALVMEMIEGHDLSALIARAKTAGRGLPLDEVLPIARQIADALEAAHEQGIVHRDLKPQNIKVRPDGTVKVLDFGLAKAADPAGTSAADLANSPTLTARATQMGMILGTAAYMSPEQAKGRAVDRRADVWAFGAVLYEMLTGQRAFDGDEITEVLASVLKTDPNWSALPADTPPSVRRLLKRCLERDVKKRLSAIGDARLELDDRGDDERPSPIASGAITAPSPATTSGAPVPPPTTSRGSSVLHQWIWPFVGLAIGLGGWASRNVWGGAESGGRAAGEAVIRTSINGPLGNALYPDSAMVSLSPDGTKLAFFTGAQLGTAQLWIRDLDSLTARRVVGAENTSLPFWSPDGRRVGFFTNSRLQVVPADGGPVETVADAPNARGGTWAGNTILFAPNATGPILKVAATGGQTSPATTLDAAKGESGHRFPVFLPDGDHFTYAVVPGRGGKFPVYVGSLSQPDQRVSLGELDTAPVYAEPGYLLVSRSGVLSAVPFDLKALKITGDPISLSDQPAAVLNPRGSYTAAPLASPSRTGALAYYSAPSQNATLQWMNRQGELSSVIEIPPGPIDAVRLSPDGRQAALVRSNSPSDSTIWLAELTRNTASPITTGHGRNDDPVWSPDGRKLVFSSDREGPQNFYLIEPATSAAETLAFKSDNLFKNVADWSPDGKTWVVDQLDADTAQNIYTMPVGGGPMTPVSRLALRDIGGRFSHDGKWISYASDESGKFQVMVQSVPPGPRPTVVATGNQSWFGRDGRSLAFVNDSLTEIWQVDLTLGTTVTAGPPRKVANLPPGVASLDATPDLDRFLIVIPESRGPGSLTLVQGWRNALHK